MYIKKDDLPHPPSPLRGHELSLTSVFVGLLLHTKLGEGEGGREGFIIMGAVKCSCLVKSVFVYCMSVSMSMYVRFTVSVSLVVGG